MRIAVFDENSYNSNYLKQLIYSFSNYKKIDLVVDTFVNARDFLKTKQDYILCFISFETATGILAAQKLFDDGYENSVIITAKDSRLAAEAFKINAYNFLQTPLNDKLVYKILNNYFSTFQRYTLLIRDGCENIFINTNDILYIEANNKHCLIHLSNQTVCCNKTMAKVYEVLPKEQFLKTSRAYVVNAYYISRFNHEHIILTNGETLYPSKHFYKSFKYDFLCTINPRIP